MARNFNGTNQSITVGSGAFAGLPFTYGTMAVILRPATLPGTWKECISSNTTLYGGLTPGNLWVFDPDGSGSGGYSGVAPTAATWYCVIATKATGTSPVVFNIYNYTTSTWTSVTGGDSIDGGGATSNFWIASYQGGFDFWNGDIAAVGLFRQWIPSSAAAQAAGLHVAASNWVTAAASADRAAVWILNQAATSTQIVDATGGGANETTSGVGTVVAPPAEFNETLGGAGTAAQSALATSTVPTPGRSITAHPTAQPASAASTVPQPTAATGGESFAPAQPASAASTAAQPAASSSGTGNPILDEAGNPILDEAGNPVLDNIVSAVNAPARTAEAFSAAARPAANIPNPVARVAQAASTAAQPAIGIVNAAAAVAGPPRSLAAPPGSIGCAHWSAVLADPLLRPLRRLHILGGTVGFAASQPGSAQIQHRRVCDGGPVYPGWHHLCLYRSDRPWRPLFAGPVTAAADYETEADDLASVFAGRVVSDGGFLSESRVADPMTWMGRLVADANRQGRLPITLAPHGKFGDVQASIGASSGDTLDQVLDRLTELGVVWTMQGPVLRFGINWSAPDGGLLADRSFHRFRWRTGGDVVTEVRVVNDDGQVGVWPANSRRTPPTRTVVIDGGDIASPAALDKLARIHYDRLAGQSLSVKGAQLRRGFPFSAHQFVPGRRFVVAAPDKTLRAVVTACDVTIGGGGAETAVTVDLDKAVPVRPRQTV